MKIFTLDKIHLRVRFICLFFAYFFLDKIDMEMLALTHFIKI